MYFGSKVHKLHQKKFVLKVSKNEEQFYDLFVKNLSNPKNSHATDTQMIGTGKIPIPIQVDKNINVYQHKLQTTHDDGRC